MPFVRVPVSLTGFAGAPGVNVWHVATQASDSATADSITAAFETFYEALRPKIQNDVTMTVPNTFLEYDIETGQPEGALSGTSGDEDLVGSSSAPNSHALAYKVQLRTGRFEDGREIRGGPFLGPASGTINQAGGTWGVTDLSTIETAGAALLAALQPSVLNVYRYPRPATSPLGARAGTSAPVSTFEVWNIPAVIRGRRT